MTKYILVGGYPHKAKDGGKEMCKEAVSGLREPIKILICLFARKKDEWHKLLNDNADFFKRNLPNTKLEFTLADENIFLKQIEENNLIFFSGGDAVDLTNILDNVDRWQEKLSGKNVMGSSAGADIFSKYCYDIQFEKITENYGLIPVKTIVHYGSLDYTPTIGWQGAYAQLKRHGEEMPIWAMGEGEYMSMCIN
jgi:peptidase E